MILRRNIPHLSVDLCYDGIHVLADVNGEYFPIDKALDLYDANTIMHTYVEDCEFHSVCDAMDTSQNRR